MRITTKLAITGAGLLALSGGGVTTALLTSGAGAATTPAPVAGAPVVAPPTSPTPETAAPETGAPETEAPEQSAAAEAASPTAEKDTHDDGPGNVDHQCPPACDTAAGETP